MLINRQFIASLSHIAIVWAREAQGSDPNLCPSTSRRRLCFVPSEHLRPVLQLVRCEARRYLISADHSGAAAPFTIVDPIVVATKAGERVVGLRTTVMLNVAKAAGKADALRVARLHAAAIPVGRSV